MRSSGAGERALGVACTQWVPCSFPSSPSSPGSPEWICPPCVCDCVLPCHPFHFCFSPPELCRGWGLGGVSGAGSCCPPGQLGGGCASVCVCARARWVHAGGAARTSAPRLFLQADSVSLPGLSLLSLPCQSWLNLRAQGCGFSPPASLSLLPSVSPEGFRGWAS